MRRIRVRVLIGPGATTFTVIPNSASSTAATREKALIAPLEAAYAARPELPSKPEWEETLMIRPYPACCMTRAAICVQRNVPVALIRSWRSQSSKDVSKKGLGSVMPALFTRISSVPQLSTILEKSSVRLSGSATLASNVRQLAEFLLSYAERSPLVYTSSEGPLCRHATDLLAEIDRQRLVLPALAARRHTGRHAARA